VTKIVLDKPTMDRLGGLQNPLVICDETGLVRGHFIPSVDPELYRTVQVPFTEEELDSAEKEEGGRPLADILKDLGRQ
jgi:hypothetical protein